MLSIEKNIVYGKTETEWLSADCYYPTVHEGELPVLILVHGGAFQAGSKEMYEDWGSTLAEQGYFVMAINYQLANVTRPSYPAVLEDLAQAANWIVEQAHQRQLNPLQIGLIGDSAGAYLASLFALSTHPFSYRIGCVVGIYGVYDLVYECNNPPNDRKPNMFELLLGKPFLGHEMNFHLASPIAHAKSARLVPTFDVSFLLIHGDQDNVVNVEQTERFYEALVEHSIEVDKHIIPDVGHFWFNQLPDIKGGLVTDTPNRLIKEQVFNHLDKHLKQSLNGLYSKRQIALLKQLESINE